LNFVARLRLSSLLSGRLRLERKFWELKNRYLQYGEGASAEQLEKFENEFAEVSRQYSKVTEGIYEYERTGSTLRTFIPHPKSSAVLTLASGLAKGIGFLIPAKYKGEKKAEAGCEKSLQ